jgi:hypothetical protein
MSEWQPIETAPKDGTETGPLVASLTARLAEAERIVRQAMMLIEFLPIPDGAGEVVVTAVNARRAAIRDWLAALSQEPRS